MKMPGLLFQLFSGDMPEENLLKKTVLVIFGRGGCEKTFHLTDSQWTDQRGFFLRTGDGQNVEKVPAFFDMEEGTCAGT